VFNISNINTLKTTYFAYFHSILQYGIILGEILPTAGRYFHYKRKSSELWLVHILELHVEIYLKKLEILPLPCQYIFSFMNFFVNNQKNFQTNSSVHSINTRNKHHLHPPIANLSCFQKSAFYSSIRIFNNLPYSVTNLKNEKAQFKVALRRYLNAHSIYSVDEFLMCTDKL
jgi:hypothetical protein